MLDVGRLERRLGALMVEARVPGAALAVVSGGEVAYAGGFGVTSVEGGAPVSAETLFQIGSTTKPLTGTLIMRLVERGLLDLDRPVRDWLPQLVLSHPGAADIITLRMLLSHTAGLPWDQITPARLYGRRDPEALAAWVREELSARPFVAPPGALYSYSNPGINLVARVAEAATGRHYAELMRELLFEPLGMARTTFDPTVAMTYPLAQSHGIDDDGRAFVHHRVADNAAQYPSAFAWSSVLDLARFALLHLGDGALDGTRLLSAESIASMRRPHADRYQGLETSYGLTFMLDGRRVGHLGGINGYSSAFTLVPEAGAGVILLCNQSRGFAAPAFVDEVLEELLGPAETPQPAGLRRTSWSELAGTYAGGDDRTVVIRESDAGLVLERGTEALLLAAVRDDLFTHTGTNVVVGFPPPVGANRFMLLNGAVYRRNAS